MDYDYYQPGALMQGNEALGCCLGLLVLATFIIYRVVEAAW